MKKYLKIIIPVIISIGLVILFLPKDTKPKKPKYVFLFIGDGMGLPHIRLTELYTKNPLVFLNFPEQALTKTDSLSSAIGDSAGNGTAIATGQKTTKDKISKNHDGSKNLKTIAEFAKQSGSSVGIVSTSALDHATPAVFYAHTDNREKHSEIDKMYFETKTVDFAAGGEFLGSTIGAIKLSAFNNNVNFINTPEGFEALTDLNKKTLVFNSVISNNGEKSFEYAIDNKGGYSLADFTKKGIDLLYDKGDNFFMMIEGSMIDWAAHNNDAKTMVYEVIEFNKAVKEAIKFYNKHPDETLIIVTADHSTGGLAIGCEKTKYKLNLDVLEKQKASFPKKNILANMIANSIGINMNQPVQPAQNNVIKPVNAQAINTAVDGKAEVVKSNPNIYMEGLNEEAGVCWTTKKHEGTYVATFGVGPGSEFLKGVIDNTQIGKNLINIYRENK